MISKNKIKKQNKLIYHSTVLLVDSHNISNYTKLTILCEQSEFLTIVKSCKVCVNQPLNNYYMYNDFNEDIYIYISVNIS